MKSETFKNIAAGIQSTILAVSIPVAGYWTYTTFDATAQAKTERIKYKKLQEELKEKRSLAIEMDSEVVTDDGEQIIFTTINIENDGNREESFSVSEDQISVFQWSKFGTDTPAISRSHSMIVEHPGGEHVEYALNAGEKAELIVVSQVNDSGLYTLEFQIPIKSGDLAGDDWVYIGTDKIVVTDP